jgi:hypothetical protein
MESHELFDPDRSPRRLSAAALTSPALAQTVKVTPLGGIDGEFCPQDRALIFEDAERHAHPVRPGPHRRRRDDPRLGKIDIVLVSHMHGDHAGNAHNKAPNSGTCEQPDMSVSAMPNSNAANIAIAKKSKIVTGSEMPPFFAPSSRRTAAIQPTRSSPALAAA